MALITMPKAIIFVSIPYPKAKLYPPRFVNLRCFAAGKRGPPGLTKGSGNQINSFSTETESISIKVEKTEHEVDGDEVTETITETICKTEEKTSNISGSPEDEAATEEDISEIAVFESNQAS